MLATPSDIKKAAALLREGKLVAFPTETVYGLGGNALNGDAVAKIYAAKGRPQFNPLIVHVRSIEDANHHVEFNDNALKLARAFWPGPLTLVLNRRKESELSLLVSTGLDSVAVRMPAHELAQALLHEAGTPIAAPSANRSGRISPTQAEHVREELGDLVPMILDGGPCHIGIESTVVDPRGEKPMILRPGSITREQIIAIIGDVAETDGHHEMASPGMLASHYAPAKPVRLNAIEVKDDEALLAFGADVPSNAKITENLSVGGNLHEAAANLFHMLRKLDASDARQIAVMHIPNHELGLAINDRLKRAATR